MQVSYDGAPFPTPAEGSAVTIGMFDGVHRGHQALIGEAQRLADELECPTIVVTFDRHPAAIVRPESAPRLLTDLHQKLDQLDAIGVDHTYVIRFDEDRSLEPPDKFVQELVEQLAPKVIVVGEDFHFGHRRRGDVALLNELGAASGFKVLGVGLVEVPGFEGPVSSTAIRAALAEGDIDKADLLLGRDYSLRGVVEPGDDRGGSSLGFPTANVAVAGDVMLPADGVYSGWYDRPDGSRHPAAISVGRRPTFYEDSGLLLVEAHILDFEGDLYGEQAIVEFEKWLRGQVRFKNVDELIRQIQADVDEVRRTLG